MAVPAEREAADGRGEGTDAGWVDTLELLAEVLARSGDSDPGTDDFYARLAEVVCQLGHFRRALIFRYDPPSRRVIAAGAYGLDPAAFAGTHVSLETAPIAAKALHDDRVVEISGALEAHFPPQFAALVREPARLICVPIGAAEREVGVIFAERSLEQPRLSAAERRGLWALGKSAALAAVSRTVANQHQRARQLEQRIDLAREVHEGVIQRLFGVSMALDGDGDLPADERLLCAQEMQRALAELRTAMQRPLARSPRATQTTLKDEIARLTAVNPTLGLTLDAGDPTAVPVRLEPLLQSVLGEAVRNAAKHARPSRVGITLEQTPETWTLEVVNDGVDVDRALLPGLGLRLAAFEALQVGGVVEFGQHGPGTWRVRLMVPADA